MDADVTLKDARRVFSDELSRLLNECGINGHATMDEIKTTIALCTAQHDLCWADLIQWVQYGDDEQAKTRDIVRASMRVARMWQ